MFRTPLFFILLVATVVGGPYVAMETDWGRSIATKIQALRDGGAGTGINNAWQSRQSDDMNAHHQTENLWDRLAEHPHHDHQWIKSNDQQIAGGPFRDFRDVLRFDATPTWVASQFSRVTTVLSDQQLQGLRVPVVTGSAPNDLAGTITYYFTNEDKLQRLTFNGFSGDPTRLVSLMLSHYHLEPDHSMGQGGYSYGWNGNISSVMKVTPTPVIYAQSPNARFTIFLEINQPDGDYGISYAAKDVLATTRGVTKDRWPRI